MGKSPAESDRYPTSRRRASPIRHPAHVAALRKPVRPRRSGKACGRIPPNQLTNHGLLATPAASLQAFLFLPINCIIKQQHTFFILLAFAPARRRSARTREAACRRSANSIIPKKELAVGQRKAERAALKAQRRTHAHQLASLACRSAGGDGAEKREAAG